MSKATGFLLRTSTSDDGTLPRTGPWTGCPDIIPAGITAQSKNDLLQSYDKVIDYTLSESLTNYIYVRAKNLNSAALTQKVWLFAVPGSLVLRPEQWYNAGSLLGLDTDNPSGTGDPDNPDIIKKYGQIITADPGQIAVTDAYTWKPQTTEHHCLVAVAANSWDDVLTHYPGSNKSSLDALAQWIYANGSIGWHNVNIQPISSTIYESYIAYSNTDLMDEKVTFTMVANNVPVGSRISFSSNNSTSSGQVIGQDWVTVSAPPGGGTINPDFEIGTTINVNANYQTIITYRTDFNGTTPPDDFAMHIKASIPTSSPPARNSLVAQINASDSLENSYLRSHSSSAIFTSPSGQIYGQGVEGYRSMAAAAWGPSGGGGHIGNSVVVVVGSHTTRPGNK